MAGGPSHEWEEKKIEKQGELAAAVELRGIDKFFGDIHANQNIDLAIRAGTVHGIVGENGAGKSTLMSILYGHYQADAGSIYLQGRQVLLDSPAKAIAQGIGMVHQHFMLVDNFSVLENVILGVEHGLILRGALTKARAELQRLAENYQLAVDPDALAGELSVGLQQRVEILKALFRGADTLILDEPTGVLTPSEVDHLFAVLKKLQGEGKTILLVTHKLHEIMEITQNVSVMRSGRIVAERRTCDTSMDELAELMVGRPLKPIRARLNQKPGKEILRAVSLSTANTSQHDSARCACLRDVSFSVHAGEIVAIAGVSGNGQSELLEILSGIRPADSGEIYLKDQPLNLHHSAAGFRDLRGRGLGHVPEDRRQMGIVEDFVNYENTILGRHCDNSLYGRYLFNRSFIIDKCAGQLQKFDVRPKDPYLKTFKLSGGNQQKLILAREIEADPDLMLVGQPTRGVDVGAIEMIHGQLIDMRNMGKAILLVSAELDEVRALADRILVMHDGKIVGECTPTVDDAEIGRLMAGAG